MTLEKYPHCSIGNTSSKGGFFFMVMFVLRGGIHLEWRQFIKTFADLFCIAGVLRWWKFVISLPRQKMSNIREFPMGKLTPFTYFFVMAERIKPKMWPINHHQWLLSSVEKSIQSRHLSGWCQVLPIHYLVRIIPWLGYVVIGSTPH